MYIFENFLCTTTYSLKNVSSLNQLLVSGAYFKHRNMISPFFDVSRLMRGARVDFSCLVNHV